MNWLLKTWRLLTGWFSNPSLPEFSILIIDDIPEKPKRNKFYLVGEGPHIWCGVMLCPCGCQEIIHLNLLPEGHPKWSYKIHQDNAVSIHPSIWRTKGCHSHFFLQHGNISWCNNEFRGHFT